MGRPDLITNIPQPDIERPFQVEAFYLRLSSPETASTITSAEADGLRSQIREQLVKSGINFEAISSLGMQARLQEYQFRSFDSGKGLAISTDLSGGCLRLFQSWVMSESGNLPKLEDGDESSKGRGMMQIMANTIAFAAGAIDSASYVKDLKWQVGACYERPLFGEMKKAKEGTSEKDNLRRVLKKCRQAYDIPVVKAGNKAIRKEYSGFARAEPALVVDFWNNLNRFAAQK